MYLLLLACALLAACDPADMRAGPDGGAYDADAGGQGGVATAALIINEVAPKPTAGPDWVELYNRSDAPIDLCDYFVTDALGRLDHYLHLGASPPPASCTPVLLQANEYLVIYADDKAPLGPDHAPFKLGVADQVHIVSTRGLVVDSLVFLQPQDATGENSGESLGRLPNADGLFWPLVPSPGSDNQ